MLTFSQSQTQSLLSIWPTSGAIWLRWSHTHAHTHAHTHKDTHTYTYTHTHVHTQYARTEWLKNTLNPNFSKAIEIEYRFEEVQKLVFSVYDIDNISPTLDDDDFLGCIECSLGEVSGCGLFSAPIQIWHRAFLTVSIYYVHSICCTAIMI